MIRRPSSIKLGGFHKPRKPSLNKNKFRRFAPKKKFDWEFPEYGPNWDELSRLCKERDNYRCVLCGSTKGVQAAHIVSKRHGGKDVLSNLRTLCIDCHAEEHPHMRHIARKFNQRRKRVDRPDWLTF